MTYKLGNFYTIAVSGQADVAAPSTGVLTLISGANTTLTTGSGSVTIAADDTGSLQAQGYARVSSSTGIYAHRWYGDSQGGVWTYSLGTAPSTAATADTLTLTVAEGSAYMAVWIAEKAGNVDRVQAAWYQAFANLRVRCRLWKCTPVDNSSSNQTWTAIGTGAINATAGSSVSHTAEEDLSSDANRSFSKGDLLGITFDGRNIDGSNYGSSNTNNRTTFNVSVAVTWS